MRAALTLTLGALLAACQGTAPRAPQPAPPPRPLAPVSAALPALELSEQVRASHGKQHYRFIALLSLRPGQLHLAALSPLGAPLFEIAFDGEHLDTHTAVPLPPGVDARRIIADLQAVHWPRAALAAALGRQWQVRDSRNRRTLAYRGQPYLRIQYNDSNSWYGSASLDNLVFGYHLDVSTIELHKIDE